MIGSYIIIATLLVVYLVIDGATKTPDERRTFQIFEHTTCYPCGFEFVLDSFKGGNCYDCKVHRIFQHGCSTLFEVRNEGLLWYTVFADFDYNSSINIVTITDEITGCSTMLDFSACDPFVKKALRNVLVFDRLFYDEREVLWDDERGARAAPPKKMKVIFLK